MSLQPLNAGVAESPRGFIGQITRTTNIPTAGNRSVCLPVCCNSPSQLRVGTLDERRGNSRHGVNRVYPSSIVILSCVSASAHTLSFPLSIYLSLYLFIYLSIHPSIYLSIFLSVSLPLFLLFSPSGVSFVLVIFFPPGGRPNGVVSWTTFLALALMRTFGQLATKDKNSSACLYRRE